MQGTPICLQYHVKGLCSGGGNCPRASTHCILPRNIYAQLFTWSRSILNNDSTDPNPNPTPKKKGSKKKPTKPQDPVEPVQDPVQINDDSSKG